MDGVIYGFAIGELTQEPVWFHHRESAENYSRAHGQKWQIKAVSADSVNPDDILDNQDSIWTPGNK